MPRGKVRGACLELAKLVREGAPVRTQAGQAVLVVTAARGDRLAVRDLLDRSAAVNSRDIQNVPPLMWASIDNADVVRLLLAHGADVHARDVDGRTALIEAAANRDSEIVKVLIAAGAEIAAAILYGETPLMDAAARDDVRVVQVLVASGAGINTQDQDGATALMHAARWGARRSVHVLVAYGAGMHLWDTRGWTAVRFTRGINHLRIA